MTPPLDETTIGAILAAAGALAAVTILLVILVRRRRPARIDSPEDAASAVEMLLGADARVCGAVVGADGSGALAVTDDGRVAAVRRRGGRLVAREVAWQAVRSIPGGILIETGDRQLGEIALTGVDVLDIRRLTPRGVKA